MRILVYALPRTGSNNLTRYIANSLYYKEIIEPYHHDRKWDWDLTEADIWERDNVVVKMIIGQGDYYFEDIKPKFDKVVILYRENIKEQAESYVHAANSVDWHVSYTYDPTKVTEEEYLDAYTKFTTRVEDLKRINEFTVKYEDLYISGIGKDELDKYLGITNRAYRFMLDGKNKYRREPIKEIKTLI
jgi:hypothetical protein